MTPRPYQSDCITAVEAGWKEFQKQLVVIPTGGGKTIIFAHLSHRNQGRTLILAHREELITQAAAKLKAATGIIASIDKAEEVGSLSSKVVVGSIQTLMRDKRRERWPADHFSLVVVDEAHHCFPAGTRVDGRPIETLRPGDYLDAFSHTNGCIVRRRVNAVMAKQARAICRVVMSNGREIVCTPNHPFWNGKKYIAASMLSCEDMVYEKKLHQAEDMLCVRDGLSAKIMESEHDSVLLNSVQSSSSPSSEENSRSGMPRMRGEVRSIRAQAVSGYKRQDVLQQGVRAGIPNPRKFGNHGEDQSKVCLCENEVEQSHAEAGSPSKDDSEVEGAAISQQDGQRSFYAPSNSTSRGPFGSRTGVQSGTPDFDAPTQENNQWPAASDMLQGGHRTPGLPFGYRNRRQESQVEEAESAGRLEDRGIVGVRVERVEVYQRGSGPEFDRLCPDGCVYNIEVAGCNNYFAEGILVHNCLAASYRAVLDHFSGARILGVTATPDRGDKKSLGEFFETIAYEISLFDLIKAGYLSPIAVQGVPLQIDLNNVECTAGDFRGEDLGDAIEPYLGQIVQAIKRHAGFRRTLAFLPLIATSQKFVAACNDFGLRAAHVDGESDDRKEILDRFAGGEFDILSNAMLLTEGYDVDSGPTGVGIDCVVVLRPTRSRPLFAQMVGRGTRTAELKSNLLLLDFLWMHKKHRICRPASLVAKCDDEADAIMAKVEVQQGMPEDVVGQLDLIEVAKTASLEREEALRKKLAEEAKNRPVFISSAEFAMRHNSLAAAEYEPTMPWHGLEITDAQRKRLKALKIDLSTVRGRGHASELIGLHYSVPQAASPRQKGYLKRMGHPNWSTATAREAQRFFAQMKKGNAA